MDPNGHPVLAGWADPVYRAFVSPLSVDATTVATSTTVSPRAGFAYDLTGDNKTVLTGYVGRFYFNSADTLADGENPVGVAIQRYQFLDTNGNFLLDGPSELGRLLSVSGNAGSLRGRSISVRLPGAGTETVRVEEVTANRAPAVSILDLRADKSFAFGRAGKVTAIMAARPSRLRFW